MVVRCLLGKREGADVNAWVGNVDEGKGDGEGDLGKERRLGCD